MKISVIGFASTLNNGVYRSSKYYYAYSSVSHPGVPQQQPGASFFLTSVYRAGAESSAHTSFQLYPSLFYCRQSRKLCWPPDRIPSPDDVNVISGGLLCQQQNREEEEGSGWRCGLSSLLLLLYTQELAVLSFSSITGVNRDSHVRMYRRKRSVAGK